VLTSLSVQNFKSWREIQEMQLKPITGLFGTNSSGKTSILQLLLMLKQTAESPDRAQVLNLGGDDRSRANLGTFRDVVFRHGQELASSLSWKLPDEIRVMDPAQPRNPPLIASKTLSFSSEVTELKGGRLSVKQFAYRFADHCFRMERINETGTKYRLEASGSSFEPRRSRGRPPVLAPPVKCYGWPDQVRAAYQNVEFLADLELAFEQLFGRVYYLGPLREYPQRQYTWAGAQPVDMGQRGERVVDALLSARERELKVSPGPRKHKVTLEAYVAEWLKRLGLIHTFTVAPITPGGNLYEVRVQKAVDSEQVLITDVGFGVSQVLPVLVLCYYVPEGSTLILEQPEIHLHPLVQAGLADVFIDAVKVRRIQILVESHSEHLLLRLQRRMAEEKLAADDAALYFCDLEQGASRLQRLDLDEYGNIRNWPQDFFGNQLQESVAMMDAVMERRKQQAA
jgi:predicted ATPase